MPTSRRSLILAAGSAILLAPRLARAEERDPRLAERALGKPDAPVTVQEFFSLTCTHCAAFARDVFPRVKSELIDGGKLRYVFRDFPLDQVALTAAMVARALPPERYEPFVLALLASQDRWAFARGVNSTEELAKTAALAGMPRSLFDATVNDAGLKAAILHEQDVASHRYAINSTPSFVFDGAKAHDAKRAGELNYDAFAQAVAEAG